MQKESFCIVKGVLLRSKTSPFASQKDYIFRRHITITASHQLIIENQTQQMNIYKQLALTALAAIPACAMAQGTNHGLGGDDIDIKSLYELVTKHEQKSKAVKLYINYGVSNQTSHDSRDGEWSSRFSNRYLRIEMIGWLTDKIYYRFRQRLNKSNEMQSEDQFAKATDYMMVGWQFNDHWRIQGGKKCQALGSFEFDENPLFIYQFSDIEGNVDSSKGAINLLYNVTPNQQLSVEVSNTYNGKLKDEFGEDAKVSNGTVRGKSTPDNTIDMATLEKSNTPFAYSMGWNGSFFSGKLQTRWSYTLRTQAKHKYSRFLRFGQKLNLSNLQWYVDYNMTYDDLDRMKIVSGEVADALAASANDNNTSSVNPSSIYAGKVRYQGVVTKMNWQFAPDWNLMLKGMYETASMTKSEQFGNYRTALGYVGSIEYYPARKQKQNLRLFLAYTGRKYNYSKASQIADYNTDRIELGMLYRMKLL